jgi:hypothetical protein
MKKKSMKKTPAKKLYESAAKKAKVKPKKVGY